MILLFKKKGFLRFLSAIETANLITRTLIRSGLKLQYSEGFHPKPKISFLDSTPTGVIDLALYVSVQLDAEKTSHEIKKAQILKSVNEVSPFGLELADVFDVEVNLNRVVDEYEYLVFSKEEINLKKEFKKHSGKVFIPSELLRDFHIVLRNGIYVLKYRIAKDNIFNPYLLNGVFLVTRKRAFAKELDLHNLLNDLEENRWRDDL
ncbi:MAG: TIGR03936 family radical SAM-associated protein [Fervidobacterium sp.]|uniref:Radical SAM-linked protein n=1 Tax=Fervidobacterium gondwanense DSM 13020 TaxID=1121883 RepID=A0A1M7SDT2_FERGO|nr:TIGR03936 family radical SAM-associated protein [Fervidobacterium gondwanense]SHN56661.1 radical SAM-linked protein [Fervidobacterium gondwanense DSM 13020]